MGLSVTVSIVLHESGDDIDACLSSIRAQTRAPDCVVILDNASADDGADRAAAAMPDALLERSPVNVGFAAGQNRLIKQAPSDLQLVLNPDCRIAPEFIEIAASAFAGDARLGSLTGRLLRFREESVPGPLVELPDDRLDSTGMVAFRNRRVLDRGSEESAAGRYTTPEDVFGASGAAAVFRRTMLEDVAFEGEFFDESFFAYREDVDLAWRAQLLGWRCRYEPAALARHRRRVAPGRRRRLPGRINRLSIANRWRMIAKNELAAGWRRDWRPIAARDLQIVGYAVLREQTSLAALADVLGDAGRLRERRRDVMRRRVATDDAMLAWFGDSQAGATLHR
jgi:GT2 family glycosyltransferase